jgi:starvation-inducible DNA-binding protein
MQSKKDISLTGKARESLARVLDHVLQDECFLLAITRDYRWNVTGPNLYSLHRLFDEQRRQLDYWLNRVFELTTSFGLGARNGVEKKMRKAEGDAPTGAGLPAGQMLGELLTKHEEMAHRLRHDLERLRDPATTSVLSGLMEFHETTAWMLRMVANTGPTSERMG